MALKTPLRVSSRTPSWVAPGFKEFDNKSNNFVSNACFEKVDLGLCRSEIPLCQKLWIEEDPLLCEDDLAIHKKKLNELKEWMQQSTKAVKGKNFLLLTGPPGAGKSAAVKVLAKALGLDVREWVNKAVHNWKSERLLVVLKGHFKSGKGVVKWSINQQISFPKALNRILQLRTKNSKFCKEDYPSKSFLLAIAKRSGGDIRNAINTLQIALTKNNLLPIKGGKKFKAKKHSSDSLDDLEFIGSKDTKLMLFRAIGKVLYCKRKSERLRGIQLPSHLCHEERLPMEEDPENVFECSSSDSSTFGLFLHHNCPPFFKDIEPLSKSLHYISDADILQSYWNASNVLDHYSASVHIRGIMHYVSENSSKTFRSITRPTFFSYLQNSKQHLDRLIRFRTHFCCSEAELVTNVVPLVAKIRRDYENDNFRFVMDVGLMFAPSGHEGTTQNGNIVGDVLMKEEGTLQMAEDPNEDFMIEEFPD